MGESIGQLHTVPLLALPGHPCLQHKSHRRPRRVTALDRAAPRGAEKNLVRATGVLGAGVGVQSALRATTDSGLLLTRIGHVRHVSSNGGAAKSKRISKAVAHRRSPSRRATSYHLLMRGLLVHVTRHGGACNTSHAGIAGCGPGSDPDEIHIRQVCGEQCWLGTAPTAVILTHHECLLALLSVNMCTALASFNCHRPFLVLDPVRNTLLSCLECGNENTGRPSESERQASENRAVTDVADTHGAGRVCSHGQGPY